MVSRRWKDADVATSVMAGVMPRPDWAPISVTSLPTVNGMPVTGMTSAWAAVAYGQRAVSLAQEALRGRPVIVTVTTADSPSGWENAVDEVIDVMRAGDRILLVGPERAVLVGAARARARGAIDAEIALIVTDREPGDSEIETRRQRRAFCGHCHIDFAIDAAIGDGVNCPSCGSLLAIHHHFSRARAAFLGFPIGVGDS